MTDGKVEDAHVAAGLTLRRLRDIAVAFAVNLQVYHGMLNPQLAEVDFVAEH